MPAKYLVAVPCEVSSGIFSTEPKFKVSMANGDAHIGLSPIDFCWNNDGQPLQSGDNYAGPGMVAAKIVDELENQQVAVELPDGEVVAVKEADVRPRPTEIRPPQRSERTPHVSLGSRP